MESQKMINELQKHDRDNKPKQSSQKVELFPKTWQTESLIRIPCSLFNTVVFDEICQFFPNNGAVR